MSVYGIKFSAAYFYTPSTNNNANKTTECNSFTETITDGSTTVHEDNENNTPTDKGMTATSAYNSMPYNFSEEAVKRAYDQLEPMRAEKRLNQLKSTQYLCELIGKEPPSTFEDMTETDFALLHLHSNLGRKGGYATLIAMHPNTVYNHSGKPIGFSAVYKNSFYMAQKQANFDYLYSDEGINALINEGSFPKGFLENVDIEALHKFLVDRGEEQTAILNANIERTIDSMASKDATIMLRYIRGDFAEGYVDRIMADPAYESIKNSMKELYRDAMSNAKLAMPQQENPYDFMQQMQDYANKNSSVMFYLDGKQYTMQEFEANFKSLLLGNRRAF